MYTHTPFSLLLILPLVSKKRKTWYHYHTYSLTLVPELEMSQHAVNMKRGHHTKTIVIDQARTSWLKSTAQACSTVKIPMIIRKIQVLLPTITDEPMSPDALNALDQLATDYINYSKAMKATTKFPSQSTKIHVSRNRSSPFLCLGPFSEFVLVNDY